MNRFLLLLFAFVTVTSLFAQKEIQIYPVPQQVTYSGNSIDIVPGSTQWIVEEGFESRALDILTELFEGFDILVEVAVAEDLPKSKSDLVPDIPEGYYLSVSQSGITLYGNDNAALFYGVQSLKQLIYKADNIQRIPQVELIDYPDVEFRGTVEGFYGEPWSHDDRLRQIEFYGKYKLNTYIYGPKDDPYHGFSDKWREPYPEDMAEGMKELVKAADKNKVNFVWAVHPGRDIYWTDETGDGIIDDFVACLEKFELMYDLGVRSFAVFFDDISGEGTDPVKQTEMLNFLNRNFVQKKPDVTPLIMCPTQYNRAWSGGDYLDILGSELDEDIRIMWTGNTVCADITRESMDWINNRIDRNAFIWWNWPVSDYVRTRLLIGRTYGLDPDNKGTMSGFTSNPMDKPAASKIGLFGVADYTWNMDGFNSDKSWRDGIAALFPEVADEIQVFANHNSDQGPNNHRYRREESVEIKPYMDSALEEYGVNKTITDSDFDKILAEFEAIAQSGNILKEQLPSINPHFFDETECWIYSFEALGMAGKNVMLMIAANSSKEKVDRANKVLFYFDKMDYYSEMQRKKGEPDPWATGCETGGTVVTPFTKNLFVAKGKNFISDLSGREDFVNFDEAQFYNVITNVELLSQLGVERDGEFVNIQPILEVVGFESGDYIGIALPQGIHANYVHVNLGGALVSEKGTIEISSDNVSWKQIDTRDSDGEMQLPLDIEDSIRYVRYINTSDKRVDVRLDQFKVDVPEDSMVDSEEVMYDGNLLSYYTFEKSETPYIIDNADCKKCSNLFVIGDVDNITVVYKDGTVKPYLDHINSDNNPAESLKIDTSHGDVRINQIIRF
ncbi:beta-N-acetylglucosaminidase domain-containing protein [Marinilabiliaceae bacterium ANBcel2]|nr:beta-N-acetylglucosaminidase domain-containing protein [Marinilabiliaceae bacterium ANBcel2]